MTASSCTKSSVSQVPPHTKIMAMNSARIPIMHYLIWPVAQGRVIYLGCKFIGPLDKIPSSYGGRTLIDQLSSCLMSHSIIISLNNNAACCEYLRTCGRAYFVQPVDRQAHTLMQLGQNIAYTCMYTISECWRLEPIHTNQWEEIAHASSLAHNLFIFLCQSFGVP